MGVERYRNYIMRPRPAVHSKASKKENFINVKYFVDAYLGNCLLNLLIKLRVELAVLSNKLLVIFLTCWSNGLITASF